MTTTSAGSSGLPASMRAMVLDELGGAFRLEERPVPEPGQGEVLVRCLAVGAGVTNELARNGSLGGSVPRVHGHELSGEVVAVGPGVDAWSLGGLVTTSFYLLCGRCEWCASGRETLCENFAGFIGIAVDGAFADYVVLPATNLIAIPDGVVVTERLRMRAGQRVAVIGAGGGLGVHMVQLIRAFGGVAIAVETSPWKADEISRRGIADIVVVPQSESWAGQVRDAAAGALAGVVDTVATSATLTEGYRALGRAGTLVALGHVPGAELRIDPERLLMGELIVAGTRYATRAEIARTMELVRLGKVVPIIGARYPLEQLEDALRRAHDADVFGRIMIDIADE